MSDSENENEQISPEMQAWKDLASGGGNVGCSKDHSAEIRIFDMAENDKMTCIGANLTLSQIFSRENFHPESFFRANRGLTYSEYSFPDDIGLEQNDSRFFQSQDYLDTLSTNCSFERARMFASLKSWEDALKALYRGSSYTNLSRENKMYYLLLRAKCNLGLLKFDDCFGDLRECQRLLQGIALDQDNMTNTDGGKPNDIGTTTPPGHKSHDWYFSEYQHIYSQSQYAMYKYNRDKKNVAKKMLSRLP